jgi:hypothetical protein
MVMRQLSSSKPFRLSSLFIAQSAIKSFVTALCFVLFGHHEVRKSASALLRAHHQFLPPLHVAGRFLRQAA